MSTFYNTNHPLISHFSSDLVFGVDYGNPKCSPVKSLTRATKDAGAGVGFINVGTPLGHALTSASHISYTRYKDNTLSTHNYSNGFSVIIICSVDKTGSKMFFGGGGMIGSGTSTATHFLNFELQRVAPYGYYLIHRITNAAGNGTVATSSDYLGSQFPETEDNEIFMVGYTHSISSLTFYAHGLPITTKSISSSINTTYPNAGGNEFVAVNGTSWQVGAPRWHHDAKIFMAHVYKRPLTNADHLSFFNTFKNRYNL